MIAAEKAAEIRKERNGSESGSRKKAAKIRKERNGSEGGSRKKAAAKRLQKKKGKEQIRERQSQKGCGNDKVIYRIFMHRLFVPSGFVREACAAKSENIVDTI